MLKNLVAFKSGGLGFQGRRGGDREPNYDDEEKMGMEGYSSMSLSNQMQMPSLEEKWGSGPGAMDYVGGEFR